MLQFIVKYGIEFLLIFLIFATGVWTFMSVHTPLVKIILLFGLVSIYFIWAVWHHMSDEKKIDFNVLMEYFAVIVLVLWILLTVM